MLKRNNLQSSVIVHIVLRDLLLKKYTTTSKMLMNFAISLQDKELLSSLFYRHDSTPERLAYVCPGHMRQIR